MLHKSKAFFFQNTHMTLNPFARFLSDSIQNKSSVGPLDQQLIIVKAVTPPQVTEYSPTSNFGKELPPLSNCIIDII